MPSEGVMRFTLLAMLLSSWLHWISGRHDLTFDAPVSGRPTADARRALGVCIEMFPFAVAVEPADTFRTLAGRCGEEAIRFLRHALPGTSAPSGATAGRVVLNYVPAAFGSFAGLTPEVEWVHPGHADSVHALRLHVTDFAGTGRYELHVDFNHAALEERLRHRSLQHFAALLDACLDDPDRPIASVDILTADERQALAAINPTDGAPRPAPTVVDLFEQRARADPDTVALRQGGTAVTFAALRTQVARLAAALVAHGVVPGDRVAIASRRSIAAVVAILATKDWK
jgi:non-ribosomal peptide synthetase component F